VGHLGERGSRWRKVLRVVGGSIREMVGETVESWKDKGSRGDGSQSWLSWENSGEEGVGRMSSKKPTMYAVARNVCGGQKWKSLPGACINQKQQKRMTRGVSALKVGENRPTSEPCVKAPLISCLLPAPCGENKAGKSSTVREFEF
jgi:hypothetical protein